MSAHWYWLAVLDSREAGQRLKQHMVRDGIIATRFSSVLTKYYPKGMRLLLSHEDSIDYPALRECEIPGPDDCVLITTRPEIGQGGTRSIPWGNPKALSWLDEELKKVFTRCNRSQVDLNAELESTVKGASNVRISKFHPLKEGNIVGSDAQCRGFFGVIPPRNGRPRLIFCFSLAGPQSALFALSINTVRIKHFLMASDLIELDVHEWNTDVQWTRKSRYFFLQEITRDGMWTFTRNA